MDDLYTLDDLARLDEEQAVRSRCDAANLRVVRRFLFGFAVVAFFEIVAALGEQRSFGLAVAAGNLALAVLALLTFRRAGPEAPSSTRRLRVLDPLARRIERHVAGAAVAFLIVQYSLVMIYNLGREGVQPWFILFPFAVAFFRLATVEALLVHGTLFGSGLVFTFLISLLGLETDELIVGGVLNAINLALGLWLTRRYRKVSVRRWLTARERHRDELRMRQELDYARQIQLSMLPPENPKLGWLDVASLSLPATEVGGDYFDYFEIGDGRLAVVAGDVAGHGFAAGLLLAGLRSCLTLLVGELDQPERVMSRLNHVVRETTRRRMLVTLVILVLDRDAGRAALVSAGHPPVLVRRAAGTVEELTVSSLPLGSRLAERFAHREVAFAAGDAFLLYTDGLYETTDADDEPYGIDRLSRTLGEAGGPAKECREAILKDLWTFKGDAAQADDVTFVVLKVR